MHEGDKCPECEGTLIDAGSFKGKERLMCDLCGKKFEVNDPPAK